MFEYDYDYMPRKQAMEMPAQVAPGQMPAQMMPGTMPAQMMPGAMPAQYAPAGVPGQFIPMGTPGPCAHMAAPSQVAPIAAMPEQQLEAMYPRIYFIILPVIMRQCDMVDAQMGHMHIPTKEQVDAMVDDISTKIEVEVEVAVKQSTRDEERQFGFAGRRLLRDLVGIMLIRELVRRRRRPIGFYPGYYPGYFGYGIY